MKTNLGNVLLVVLIALGIMTVSVGGYFYWQRQQVLKNEPLTWEECLKIPGARKLMTYPEQCVTPDGRKVTQPLSDEEKSTKGGSASGGKKLQPPDQTVHTEATRSADWKTFTNQFYEYQVKAPADFSLKTCQDCNPPEANFTLQNSSGSIVIGYAYAAQGSLTGNASAGEYKPVKNLDVVIQGKACLPEEYYDTLLKYYVFDIPSILNNGEDRQIRVTGRYVNESDKQLVSQILSSFKFIGSQTFQYSCPQNGWQDCQPILTPEAQKGCAAEALQWYKKNCPDFKGVAY